MSHKEVTDPLEAQSFQAVFRELLLPVFAPSFLMSMCQGIVALMIPLYALELGANPALAALIFSLRGLGNVISDVPAGSIASRLGDKTAMLIGVALMCAAAFSASLVNTPVQLAIVAPLFGAAMATWLIGRLTFVTEAVPDSHRGKSIATMAGLQRFGTFLGPIAAGVIAMQYGFEVVFILVAVIAGLSFCLVAFLVSGRRNTESSVAEHTIWQSIPAVIRGHWQVFATAGLAMLLLTMLRASRQLMIPLWGEHLGLNTAEIGFIMGLAAAVDMSMFPVAGYMMDNHGRKPVAISCLTFISLGLLCVPFSSTPVTLALAAAISGFGNGLGSGINMTLGADLSPPGNRGEFLGLWRLVGDSGVFAGPMLIGVIIQALSLAAAFPVAAGAGLLGILIMAFRVKETRTPG